MKNIAPLNTVSFNRGDTFVASKKLSESAPPATPATLFPLFGNPELQQIPSQPTYTNYGVAVDFAGATDDNPLYRGRRPDEDNDDGDNRSVGSAVNIGVLGLGVASDVGVAIDQVSGSVVPPTDLYRVQSESPGREQRQPIRPYSPSYNDAIYDDSWPQSAPGDASSGRNVNRESEYYYKGVEDYPPTPDYNALHYQSSRDRNYGEGHHKRYQEEERNQYGGEGHRDRYADDSDFGNHDHRAFHDNRDRDENRDIGALDYHDQVRAPRPPRDQNPNAGKSFPDNYDGDDAEEGGSAFRQFFAGDGLAAPPPKRVRESHERRDRDRDRGRDRESSKDRKRRERNKSKPDKRKRRPPPRPKKKKKEKKKDPKTLQHLQSDKSRERNKDKKRENPRGKR